MQNPKTIKITDSRTAASWSPSGSSSVSVSPVPSVATSSVLTTEHTENTETTQNSEILLSTFNGQETMRIDEQEKEALNDAIEEINGEVYLFGSRTDDNAKGGDIDILVITSDDPFEVSRKVTVEFTMRCDEKIDVIAVPAEGQSDNHRNFLKTLETIRLK